MAETPTHLEESIDQMMAALDGDFSHVTIHEVDIKPAPQFSADEVKAIRKEVGLTQRVLAKVLSVSPRTVEAWETGRSHPSRTASRLLEAIQKDPGIVQLLIG